MEISRLTFRKETKEAIEKELTPKEKGELRWERLKELEKDGRLSLVKTRKELAAAAGYDEDELHQGVSWVFRLINNGHITETLLGFNNKTKTPEYEYHLTNKEPLYRIGRPKQHPKEEVKGEWKWRRWQDKVATGQIPQAPSIIIDDTAIKVELTKGDILIKIELKDYKQASNLIKEILKGEQHED